MSIQSDLKNEGICIKSTLDQKQINKISLIIAKKISHSFPEFNLSTQSLFDSLSKINMYIADFSGSNSMAKYYSKTNSIYFNSEIDFDNVDILIIHECLHAIQESRNSSGKIIKLRIVRRF